MEKKVNSCKLYNYLVDLNKRQCQVKSTGSDTPQLSNSACCKLQLGFTAPQAL